MNSWKIVTWLSLAGGGVSVVGNALIRLALSLWPIGRISADHPEAFILDPKWQILAFISGLMSVAFIAPFFLRKVRETAKLPVKWSRYGLSFGALAGVCNVVILASIHLGLWAIYDIRSEGLEAILPAISLFLTYLPLSVLMLGLPAAAIGVFAGITAEFMLRRFVF